MPEESSMPVSGAPVKASEETVSEDTETKSSEETAEQSEVAEQQVPEKESAEKETPEKDELEGEIEELLKEPEPEKKDNAQKRIDQLTARLKAAEDRLAKQEFEKASQEGKTPKYTDAQLKAAMKKAMEDGDTDLMWDIMQYRETQLKENLIKMYNEEKTKAGEQLKAVQNEWDSICNSYDKYAKAEEELYPGSSKDLNLRDATSLLYEVALKLYSSDDPEKQKLYQSIGGQKLAVADALTLILGKKMGSQAVKERMKKKVLKEKRKGSVSGEESLEEEKVTKPKTPKDILEEVISERSKYKNERT